MTFQQQHAAFGAPAQTRHAFSVAAAAPAQLPPPQRHMLFAAAAA